MNLSEIVKIVKKNKNKCENGEKSGKKYEKILNITVLYTHT